MSAEAKLFVGSMPPRVTDADIRTKFNEFGAVTDIHMMQPGRSGMLCAFVKYNTQAEATAARDALNGVFKFDPSDAEPIMVEARFDGKGKGGGKGAYGGAYAAPQPYPSYGYPQAGGDPYMYMQPMQGGYPYGGMPPEYGQYPGYGSMPMYSQPAPAPTAAVTDPCKLFVGNLPIGITNQELRLTFEKFGELSEEPHVLPPKGTRGTGCAFVRFQTHETAEAARVSLNNTIVSFPSFPQHSEAISVDFTRASGGKGAAPPAAPMAAYGQYMPMAPMQYPPYGQYGAPPQQYPEADPAATQSKLFVGSLPMGIQADELRGIFAPFGTLEDVYVLPPKGDRGQGCAFIKYATAEEASAAIAGLHDKHVNYPSFPDFGTPMLVRVSHGGVKRQRPW
jgi:RNA recognition motif-containing protein